MTLISVRPAVLGDVEALIELYTQLAEDRTEACPARADDSLSILASILRQKNRCLLVAVMGGAVAGTADMLIVENLTYGGRPWVIVENVVVGQEHRGHGVGRALVGEVLRRARDAHCRKVQLLSLKHRKDAHEFYRSLGFQALAEGFRLYLD
ncbi:MAG: GNAT family N-acetyltransferase [Acidimicrobiales bacterium]|jgi:GNAT superfamily N-acetyltransferase